MARKKKSDALKTRQQLIDAAIAQFAAHGVAKTTLGDIAEAAHVTRGALYWHFDSKEQIFEEIWKQQSALQQIIQQRIPRTIKKEPLRYLHEVFITALRLISLDPYHRSLMEILCCKYECTNGVLDTVEMQAMLGMDDEALAYWLRRCIQHGDISTQTDIPVLIIILRGALSGIIRNWLMHPERFDLAAQAPTLVDNLWQMFTVTRPVAAAHE